VSYYRAVIILLLLLRLRMAGQPNAWSVKRESVAGMVRRGVAHSCQGLIAVCKAVASFVARVQRPALPQACAVKGHLADDSVAISSLACYDSGRQIGYIGSKDWRLGS
jgi:hypothetical protein